MKTCSRRRKRYDKTPESRLASINRVLRWRRLNPGAWKIAENKKDVDHDKRQTERAAFNACHEHTCLQCRGSYLCSNTCDPIGEGLKNSICSACYAKAAEAE